MGNTIGSVFKGASENSEFTEHIKLAKEHQAAAQKHIAMEEYD